MLSQTRLADIKRNTVEINATKLPGMMQKIVDFHMNESRDWVADLECGHQQHVRHDPPWTHRHWVTTPQGRLEHVGQELNCVACRPEVFGMTA